MLQPYLIFKQLSLLMDFQIIYFISSSFTLQFSTLVVSIWLSAIVIFNPYWTPTSPKFRQLFFSFRKMWGYPTLPRSWFINFKMGCFVNLLNSWKPLSISTKGSILDVWKGSNSYFAFLFYTFYKSSFIAMPTSNFASKSSVSGNT